MNDAHDHPAATHTFWASRWGAGQIGFHRDAPNERLVSEFDRVFGALDPKASRVLVPLCGKSVDLTWLGDRFGEVVGIEFVPEAAHAYAQESGREHHHGQWGGREDGPPHVTVGNVHILVGDFFACGPELVGHFEAAYDRAALIALPPALRPAYAAHLASLLTNGGRALIVTLDYPQALRSGPPFATSDDDVVALFGPLGVVERLTHEPTREGPSGLPADATVTTSTFRFTRTESRP